MAITTCTAGHTLDTRIGGAYVWTGESRPEVDGGGYDCWLRATDYGSSESDPRSALARHCVHCYERWLFAITLADLRFEVLEP